jgi:four helix bundle protein
MAKIEKFEDIGAWQKARELTKEIYAISNQGTFSKNFGLRDQVRRASVSIMSNIAEGYERGGNKEFGQFLALAKGSCGEIRAQLYVALDQGYLDQATFDRLMNTCVQISKMLAGFLKYIHVSDLKGSKYK